MYLYYNTKLNQVHITDTLITSEDTKNNTFLKELIGGSSFYKLVLEHSPDCPARNLRLLNNEIDIDAIETPVLFAACIVVVDSCDRILVTRREKTMYIFPGAWYYFRDYYKGYAWRSY